MTVRELINRLLDEDMNAQVVAPVFRNDTTEYAHVADIEHGRFIAYEFDSGGRDITGDFRASHIRGYGVNGVPAVVMLPAQ